MRRVAVALVGVVCFAVGLFFGIGGLAPGRAGREPSWRPRRTRPATRRSGTTAEGGEVGGRGERSSFSERHPGCGEPDRRSIQSSLGRGEISQGGRRAGTL